MFSPYIYRNSIKSDESDELVNIYLQRPIAGLIVFLLYPTAATPNQVTIVSTLFGVAGGVALTLPDARLGIAAFCFYLKDILDSADGQLARAKNLFSRQGRFLDSIGDFIVDISLFGGIFVFLLRNHIPLPVALMLCVAGFLGLSLRVSYHVYYQTSFLHQQDRYGTNRVTEDLREEDYAEGKATVVLQKIFVFLYGWQDRFMVRLDQWCSQIGSDRQDQRAKVWYEDRTALRLNGMLGFGTEFVALTICLVLKSVVAYLLFTVILMNIVWMAAIFYRKVILVRKTPE